MNQSEYKVRRWRRRTAVLVAALTLIVAVAACGSSSASSGAKSKLTDNSSAPYSVDLGFVGTTPTLTGPWGFAYSKGLLQKWLASDGVTLHLSSFQNGPLMTAAIVGNSVDLGILGDTPALIAKSSGLPVKLIDQEEVGLPAWIVAQPSITSLNQLIGKSIAVQPESYMDRYVQGYLAQRGLTNKIKVVPMLITASTPAFESGQIAAVAYPPEDLPLLSKPHKHYSVVTKSETTPALQGTGVTVITNKEIAAHPGLPAIWNKVRDESIAYARSHAGAYYAWAAKSSNSTVQAEKTGSPLSSYPIPNFTKSGIAHLQSTLNFLVGIKEAKPFSLSGWEAS